MDLSAKAHAQALSQRKSGIVSDSRPWMWVEVPLGLAYRLYMFRGQACPKQCPYALPV